MWNQQVNVNVKTNHTNKWLRLVVISNDYVCYLLFYMAAAVAAVATVVNAVAEDCWTMASKLLSSATAFIQL